MTEEAEKPATDAAGTADAGPAWMNDDAKPAAGGPSWMDDAPQSARSPSPKRMGARGKGGSWQTFVFFGGIILAVAAAGTVGILVWGPEKEPKRSQHLASDPPPPTVLPSLPADSADTPAVADSAPPAAVESATPPAAAEPGPKPKGHGRNPHKRH